MSTGNNSGDPQAAVIELDAVAVRFSDVVALRTSSLRFEAGTSTALVGANGSGKSTVLKLMAGLIEPSTGFVRRRAGVTASFVAQQHGHHRWLPLTVAEVLKMGCYRSAGLFGRITRADHVEIDEVAERLEVADLERRSFGDLSGGQRQRVLVAQALIGRPMLLLLDEPITGLDLASQDTILRVIDEEKVAGSTVAFSTHHLDEARRADRVVLLAGAVIATGAPADVLTPSLLAEAYGGRVLRLGPDAVLVDDHGHGVDHDDCDPVEHFDPHRHDH